MSAPVIKVDLYFPDLKEVCAFRSVKTLKREWVMRCLNLHNASERCGESACPVWRRLLDERRKDR